MGYAGGNRGLPKPMKKRVSRGTETRCSLRCEGYRRYGGFMTLGSPTSWEQCKETATVLLKVKQKDGTKTLPACQTCWNEALQTKGIKIIAAKPIIPKDFKR